MAYFIPDFVFDELSKQFEVGLNEGFDYGESKVKALEETAKKAEDTKKKLEKKKTKTKTKNQKLVEKKKKRINSDC